MSNAFVKFLSEILVFIVDLLKHWSFVFFLIVCIFRKPIKELLSNIDILKFGKEGVELQKTAKEAKETLNDLQELATSMYIPLLDTITKMGRWDSSFTIEERLINRDAIETFVQKHSIKNKKLNFKIDSLNNSILVDLLNSMLKKLKTSKEDTKTRTEIQNLFNYSINDGDFFCNPDIEAINKKMDEHELWDDNIRYVFSEIIYFIEKKSFNDFTKLKQNINLNE